MHFTHLFINGKPYDSTKKEKYNISLAGNAILLHLLIGVLS